MSEDTKKTETKPWPFTEAHRRMAAEIAAKAMEHFRDGLLRPNGFGDIDPSQTKNFAQFVEIMERISRVPDHDAAEKAIAQLQSTISGMLGGMMPPGFDVLGKPQGN